jgi:hypothetical protein
VIGAVLVVGLAALGCSGPERRPAQTAAAVSTTSVPAGYTVAALGPCPVHDVTTNLGALNRGVAGLGKRLVPIDAVNVRICEYDSHWIDGSHVVPGNLVESALLKPRAARRFEAETNRQPPTDVPGPSGCTGAGGGALFFVLTFANDSQRTSLAWQDTSCGPVPVSNGHFAAYASSAWSIDLFRYVTKRLAS